ncbi:cinnamoyl-CoA reductase [Apiospora aurea]|uniref:Cinnamoyl-CoA reductase n=1 Tax=Apiospora aurea TaxID=335848 RepID=A0ABR1PSQ5_9PEZI
MGPTLLLTGANGFVGFKVLLSALEKGYNVRAAVRSLSKSESLVQHPKIQVLKASDRLSFVEVPDITNQQAYEEAVKGVAYVIHLASPLPSPFLDPQTGIYEPNVKSVTSMLQAASQEPSLKKLIIASSVFANMPFPPNGDKITPESRLADVPGPFDSMIPAYSAGKIGALNATERFVKENNPSFEVVNVFPGFVFGPDDRALEADDLMASTNRIMLGVVTGQEAPGPMPAGACHVYDVAKLFVQALNDGAPKNIGATVSHVFNEAWDIVKENFPHAVRSGIFTQGSQETIPIDWDAHQTEVDFGFKFKTWSDMVVDVARQYLELLGKAKE